AHLLDMPSQVQRALHLGFLGLLGFPLIMLARQRGPSARALGWGLAALAVAVAFYQWWEYQPLIFRAGDPHQADIVLGVIALIVVFAGAYVLMGPALPIIAGVFLAYALFGQHLPRPLNHRGYDFSQVI